MNSIHRGRAFLWFLLAAIYFVAAQWIADRAANGLSSGDWFPLVYRGILLFLLLVGFSAMGLILNREAHPLRAMGLIERPAWIREIALGTAIGWGSSIACVLPIALAAGLAITLYTAGQQFGFLIMDILALAIGALAQEVAFRGYPFQRLIDAIGPTLATFLMSAIFALWRVGSTEATAGNILSAILLGWLLSLAYLRTRALWVCWGIQFGWSASMGLLFGLPVNGMNFSPVISSRADGPAWLTGGYYGPEGSVFAVVVMLIAMYVLIALSRDLKHRYAQPVIVPGGIPVDLDAVSRRQHETANVHATPVAPSGPQLVQIVSAPPANPRGQWQEVQQENRPEGVSDETTGS